MCSWMGLVIAEEGELDVLDNICLVVEEQLEVSGALCIVEDGELEVF